MVWLQGFSSGTAALLWSGSLDITETEADTEFMFCCSQVQIKSAKQRVVMASLYLGTGLLEQELVSVGRGWETGCGKEMSVFAKSVLFLQVPEVRVSFSHP